MIMTAQFLVFLNEIVTIHKEKIKIATLFNYQGKTGNNNHKILLVILKFPGL